MSRALPYNGHAPLDVGMSLEIGIAKNPFFGFYQDVRAYPVTTANGEVQVRAIKFLTSVRDGTINCAVLPQIAAEVAEHYLILCRELIMEEVRQELVPKAPSRQYCLWLADTLDEAQRWRTRLGGSGQIAQLSVTGTIHRTDAAHLLGDSEPLTETYKRARAYWRGDKSSQPELETLFSGTATVVDLLI